MNESRPDLFILGLYVGAIAAVLITRHLRRMYQLESDICELKYRAWVGDEHGGTEEEAKDDA